MRSVLRSAAALAILVAAGGALWLSRPAREGRAVEHPASAARGAAADAPPAELAGGSAPGSALRERVEEPEAAPPPSAVAGPLPPIEREPAPAPDGRAELVVRVASAEDGAPLSEVWLREEPWPEERSRDAQGTREKVIPMAQTDAEGRARFELPAGGTRISCFGQEDPDLKVELAPGEKREATLLLRSRADRDVCLRLIDARSRAPLGGVRIELKGLEFVGGFVTGATLAALSDAEGYAILRLPSWLPLSADVSHAGYGPLSLDLQGEHRDREHAMEVLLVRGARLEGFVADAAGAPLERARVSAKAPGGVVNDAQPNVLIDKVMPIGLDREWASSTGPDGRYALEGLPTGVALGLEVRSAGRLVAQEPEALRLEPDEVRVRDFRVEAQGIVRGVLLDHGGRPVPGQVLLLLHGREARMLEGLEPYFALASTDPAGRFAFDGIPPGTWLIGPTPPEASAPDAVLPLAQAVELPRGVPLVEVELRLPESLFVRGRCLGPGEEPVAGVHLSAFAGGIGASAESGADGAFLLGPFQRGALELRARGTDAYAATAPLRVRAGDAGVVVPLARAARVRGTVLDAQSGAGVEAEIQVAREVELGRLEYQLVTARPDGAFEAPGLSPGRHVLVARTASGLVSPTRAVLLEQGGELAVDLAVASGARARVLLPEGPVWASVLLDGDPVEVLNGPDATTSPFRPGTFTVELRGPAGLLSSQQGSVAAGQLALVDLR